MHKSLTPRLIPALITIAFAGSASASGFQLYGEQSAHGIGNAGAGSAASAENASTIYYNPAGMTQLQAREVSLGVTAVKTSFEFSNSGSVTPGFSGNGGDGGGWGFVPNAYMSWALSKDIYVGLGIGAPFGLKTEYDKPWTGSAHSNSFEIKTVNINPSVAWRANQWLSLGGGLNFQYIEATYKRAAGVSVAPPAGVLNRSDVTLKLDDTGWGWNVGALISPTATTKIGIAYRSKVKYTAEGDISVSGPSAAVNAGGSSNAKADIELPDTFALSLSQAVGDRVELLADVTWTGWSSIPYVDIMRTSGARNGQLAQKLDTRFENAWRFAVGANYKVNDAFKMRFGVAYDQTPVPDAAHRLTSLPDNDRTWFSLGAQWKPTKTTALDLGMAYLYVKDAPINNNLNAEGKGTVTGTYKDSAWLFGAQYSMSF